MSKTNNEDEMSVILNKLKLDENRLNQMKRVDNKNKIIGPDKLEMEACKFELF